MFALASWPTAHLFPVLEFPESALLTKYVYTYKELGSVFFFQYTSWETVDSKNLNIRHSDVEWGERGSGEELQLKSTVLTIFSMLSYNKFHVQLLPLLYLPA